MTPAREFDFGTGSVATAYDEELVPVMFEPWGARLIEDYGPWPGRRVLDLATGPGILARLLADVVGPNGKVMAADINPEMLARARIRCADVSSVVELVESPAAPLAAGDETFDVVVCQQAFQFFPDRSAACREVFRVLKPGGRAIASTWRPVTECRYFGAIVDALLAAGEPEIADAMRAPFDFLPADQLVASFRDAGFVEPDLRTPAHDLVLAGGIPHGIRLAYSTPIRPRLLALSEDRQEAFRAALTERLERLTSDGTTMGQLVANVVSGRKPA